jgi:hypothetical protein
MYLTARDFEVRIHITCRIRSGLDDSCALRVAQRLTLVSVTEHINESTLTILGVSESEGSVYCKSWGNTVTVQAHPPYPLIARQTERYIVETVLSTDVR